MGQGGGTGATGGGSQQPMPCGISPPDAGFELASPCQPNEYCNAPGCGLSGVCSAKPLNAISNARDPQCGCDRVTYWNADVAAANGASIQFPGECTATVACGGLSALTCPIGALCRKDVFAQDQCESTDVGGTCWGMPPSCPMPTTGAAMGRSCDQLICVDECSLTRNGQMWFSDSTCQ